MARALEPPLHLKLEHGLFIIFWLLRAAFPLLWILIMSLKLPVDALASNPLTVIFGPATQTDVGGLGVLDLLIGLVLFIVCYRLVGSQAGRLAHILSVRGQAWLGWILASAAILLALVVLASIFLPETLQTFDGLLSGVSGLNWLIHPLIGTTAQHDVAVWSEDEFYRNFINSIVVTGGVVTISLTIGTCRDLSERCRVSWREARARCVSRVVRMLSRSAQPSLSQILRVA